MRAGIPARQASFAVSPSMPADPGEPYQELTCMFSVSGFPRGDGPPGYLATVPKWATILHAKLTDRLVVTSW